MSTSVKCNCCIKENVCKYVSSYTLDCNMIEQTIKNPTTEVQIKCLEFIPKQEQRTRNFEVIE